MRALVSTIRHGTRRAALATMLATALANGATVAEARDISYSGRVTDALGRPLQGPVQLRVEFYRGSAGGGPIAVDLDDFANVPLTMDFSNLLTATNDRRMYADLRPDTDWPGQYGISYQTIATNIVEQVKARNPAIPTIVVITHNHFEFSDPAGVHTRRLHAALDALQNACSSAGIKPIGARLDQIVDKVLATPYEEPPFHCEGYIFKKGETP